MRCHVGDVAPEHMRDERPPVEVGHRAGVHEPSVAEDCHGIAELPEFIEAVRD